ncbi:MAG: hypothetical protein IJ644_00065, partial [Oscillospiraceae bacterium]|nr:hypothetical protein [Oscillospiraceae bacterium]
MEQFAAVAMDVGSAYSADILYHYRIPDGTSCTAGDMVLVPFGKGDRQKTGFVMEITSQKPDFKIKDILEVQGSVLNPEQLSLVFWLRENTFCTFYDAVKAVLPSAVMRNRTSRIRRKALPVQNQEILVLSAEQQKVYDAVAPHLETGKPECFLLRGVTGSGKTSVFEALIARTL